LTIFGWRSKLWQEEKNKLVTDPKDGKVIWTHQSGILESIMYVSLEKGKSDMLPKAGCENLSGSGSTTTLS
jgi:hypothetical protein